MLEEEVRRLPRQRISSLMGPLSVRMAFAVPDDTGHFTEGIAGKPVINKPKHQAQNPIALQAHSLGKCSQPHGEHVREVLAYSTRLNAPVDVVNNLRAPLHHHLHKRENTRWQLLACPGSQGLGYIS